MTDEKSVDGGEFASNHKYYNTLAEAEADVKKFA